MNRIVWSMLLIGIVVGCGSSDERLANFAEEATKEQAAQNQRAAETNRAVARSHEQLLEADAQSRKELIALQHDLRADQAQVGQLRDELEVERRAIAKERRTDSAAGAVIAALVVMIACLSPLVLAAASMLGLFFEPRDGEVTVVAADELVRQESVRLPSSQQNLGPPRESSDPVPRLPS
jgi:hypothetical protein